MQIAPLHWAKSQGVPAGHSHLKSLKSLRLLMGYNGGWSPFALCLAILPKLLSASLTSGTCVLEGKPQRGCSDVNAYYYSCSRNGVIEIAVISSEGHSSCQSGSPMTSRSGSGDCPVSWPLQARGGNAAPLLLAMGGMPYKFLFIPSCPDLCKLSL